MNDPIRLALLSMHYHEARPGKWAKPVGFHLFTYSEATKEWVNWFQDGHGEMSVWNTAKFGISPWEPSQHFKTEADYQVFLLKEWEAYTRIDIEASRMATFHSRAIDL